MSDSFSPVSISFRIRQHSGHLVFCFHVRRSTGLNAHLHWERATRELPSDRRTLELVHDAWCGHHLPTIPSHGSQDGDWTTPDRVTQTPPHLTSPRNVPIPVQGVTGPCSPVRGTKPEAFGSTGQEYPERIPVGFRPRSTRFLSSTVVSRTCGPECFPRPGSRGEIYERLMRILRVLPYGGSFIADRGVLLISVAARRRRVARIKPLGSIV